MRGLGEYYAKWNKLNTVWYYLYVEPKKQTSEYNKKETFTDIKKQKWLPMEGRRKTI